MVQYSEEEENVIRTMVKAGCPLKEICEVLPERNREGIRNKILAMGLSFTKFGTQINKDALARIMKLRKG